MGGDQSIISVGWNGFPRGMEDKEEWWNDREVKYSRVIHAEMNCLIYAGGRLPEGCCLFSYPFMSCDRCIVHLIQSGIRRFVAPQASTEHMSRWGDSFAKTRKYILECGGDLVEYSTH